MTGFISFSCGGHLRLLTLCPPSHFSSSAAYWQLFDSLLEIPSRSWMYKSLYLVPWLFPSRNAYLRSVLWRVGEVQLMSTGEEEGFIHGVSRSWSGDSILYVWIVVQWFITQPMCLVIRHISSYYGLAMRNKPFEQHMYGIKYLTITPDINPERERQTNKNTTNSKWTN